MSDFAGMEKLMQDFLAEASILLSDIDSKLMGLEKTPHNTDLLNVIFRGFHTIKGGAGFLNATELVTLCHLTESLFDKLRNGELVLDAELMDMILAATGEVQQMFGELAQGRQPDAAPSHLIAALHAALGQKTEFTPSSPAPARDVPKAGYPPTAIGGVELAPPTGATLLRNDHFADKPSSELAEVARLGIIDWNILYRAVVGTAPAPLAPAAPVLDSPVRSVASVPGSKAQPVGCRENEATKDNTIRVDTSQLDQVLNLSGEIGLAKSRLAHLRSDIQQGRPDAPVLRALDHSVSQLEMLVVNLQNAVMKMRMQPIGRLFNEYPRLVSDLARQLGKDVEVVLSGEEIEIDKTVIADLNDALVHLICNAVDHGVEEPAQRAAAGKRAKGLVHLGARRESGYIRISIADDGKGMRPDAIRNKAIEKGLISVESASSLDDGQSLSLIFLPGFSANDRTSSISGHGVGMDMVKANIQKLNGTISITSKPGKGSKFTILLPLASAQLPVLLLRLCNQSLAVPLSLVEEVIPISPGELQQVSGKPAMIVRDEVLPVLSLAYLMGWKQTGMPEVGVLMHMGSNSFILSADGFIGRDDVVVQPLDTFRPKGVAGGATVSSEGEIVLILNIKELLGKVRGQSTWRAPSNDELLSRTAVA